MVYTMNLTDQSGNVVHSDASVVVDFSYYPTLDNGLWTNDFQARSPGYLACSSGKWASLSIGGQWVGCADDSGATSVVTLMGVAYKGKLPNPQAGDSGDAMVNTSGGGIFQSALITWTCMSVA